MKIILKEEGNTTMVKYPTGTHIMDTRSVKDSVCYSVYSSLTRNKEAICNYGYEGSKCEGCIINFYPATLISN